MTIKKRKNPNFRVPNFGAPNRKGVKERWRAQRGVDNKKRVHKKTMGPSPGIGYKNSAAVRYHRPDGDMEALIRNEKELLLLAGKEGYCARFAHELSIRKRLALQKIAADKNIRVVNAVRA